jgi:hypothetical protein
MSSDGNFEARGLVRTDRLRKDENLEAEMPPENGTQLEWLPFLAFTGWRFKIWFPQEGSSLPMQRQVQPDHSGPAGSAPSLRHLN